MIVINTVDAERFSLNGIEYFKNFTPVVNGDTVRVLNTYDSLIEIVKSTDYTEFIVDTVTFGSVSALQSALLPVIFTRDTLGGGGSSTFHIHQHLKQIPFTVIDRWQRSNLSGASSWLVDSMASNAGIGVEPARVGLNYQTTTCFSVKNMTKLKSMSLNARSAFDGDFEILVRSYDFNESRGNELNEQDLVSETFSYIPVSGSFDIDLTPLAHTLSSNSIVQWFIRQTGGGLNTWIDVKVDFIFE